MRLRFVALLCLFCSCVFLFCGCNSATPAAAAPDSALAATPEPTPEPTPLPPLDDLTIAYSVRDGFNPYLSSSNLVWQSSHLVYEKLVEIDPNMDISYRIASAVNVFEDSALISVRPGCTFADGTAITAEDVAASLLAAKQSSRYSARLANIINVRVQENSVLLALAAPDSLLVYLLDLPVMKAAEAATTAFATASGRYMLNEETATLVQNTLCSFANADSPDRIQLVPSESYDQMTMQLSSGNINLYLPSEDSESSVGFFIQNSLYRTNHLVYLGVNAAAFPDNPLLATPAGRQAISGALNRRQLAQKSFYQQAYPALGALNSVYPCALDNQSISPEAEYTAANLAPILAESGYSLNIMTGLFETETGEHFTLNLLVYSGSAYKRYAANLLSSQLSACGIQLLVQEESNFETFTQRIAAGEFQLYIGEVKLYNNMDMAPFFAGGAASTGIVQSDVLQEQYTAFKANQAGAAAFEAAFAAELPYIPLLWRYGRVVHTGDMSGLEASVSNVFYSVAGLTVGQTG